MDRERILVVCTANICRSPMAERLLDEYLTRRASGADVHITSAGTQARPGYTAASGMQHVAERWGLDLSYHESRRVDAQLVARQSLVVTMEQRHSDVVAKLAPGVGQRTFTVTELDEVVRATGTDPGRDLRGNVEAWHGARARLVLDAPDVVDPYRGPQEGYDRCAWQLAGIVERLGAAIATTVSPDGAEDGDGDPDGDPAAHE